MKTSGPILASANAFLGFVLKSLCMSGIEGKSPASNTTARILVTVCPKLARAVSMSAATDVFSPSKAAAKCSTMVRSTSLCVAAGMPSACWVILTALASHDNTVFAVARRSRHLGTAVPVLIPPAVARMKGLSPPLQPSTNSSATFVAIFA